MSLANLERLKIAARTTATTARTTARTPKKWYKEVGEYGNKAFNDIAAAMYDREGEILNYFVNRSTNAAAGISQCKNQTI